MILKLGARCRCHAENVGVLHAVAVEPQERIVLQLVVEQPQATPLVRVRVPFGRIDFADADGVSLAMSAADFRALPQHGAPTSRTPRRSSSKGGRATDIDERLLTARTKIECRNGYLGTLTHLLVDPRSGDLTGLAFPFGLHFARNVNVGIDQLVEIGADEIALKFDMDDLEAFPTLRP